MNPETATLIRDEIDKWLSKEGYEEIKIAEGKTYTRSKAKKSFWGYLFDVEFVYDDITRIFHTIVQSSTPVPKEKRMFCLKLLNYISYYDDEEKYILGPFNHRISCATKFCILESLESIGDEIEFSASNSILNITNIHLAIKYDDVSICDLNPIRFPNYLYTQSTSVSLGIHVADILEL
jgi:hypothetical protein